MLITLILELADQRLKDVTGFLRLELAIELCQSAAAVGWDGDRQMPRTP